MDRSSTDSFSVRPDHEVLATTNQSGPSSEDIQVIQTTAIACPTASAWATRSGELAEWAVQTLVNRHDAHGRYLSPDNPLGPSRVRTAKSTPDYSSLERHFRGESISDLVGLHTTSPENTGRWVVIDIDRHDETVSFKANLDAAFRMYEEVEGLGITPLLLDSNGDGGFHLWVIFDRPIPISDLYWFGHWVLRACAAGFLGRDPEVFPKQSRIEEGSFGNFVRLPGRHHTRDHWTRVWGGDQWLIGDQAISAILACRGSNPALIPEEARTPTPSNRKVGERTLGESREPLTAGSLLASVRDALNFLPAHYCDDYESWLKVGMTLSELGGLGRDLWDEWSKGSNKYREGEVDEKWQTFGREQGVTLGTLFHWAQQEGWPGSGRCGDGGRPSATKQLEDSPSGPEPMPAQEDQAAPEDLEGRVIALVQARDREAFLDDQGLHRALARLRASGLEPARCLRIEDMIIGAKLLKKRELDALLKPHRPVELKGRGRQKRQAGSPPDGQTRGVCYVEAGGWTAIETISPEGSPEHHDLAPFLARVEEQVIYDDGVDTTRRFRVAGTRHGGYKLATLDLSSDEFMKMDWPITMWGQHIEAIRDHKNHLRAAILKLSEGFPTRTVFKHVGWRSLADGAAYLHAGGAITSAGLDEAVQVELPDRLAYYHLPVPPRGERLHQAIRAVLGLLDLGDPKRPGAEALAAIVLALPFRAALGETLFNVWIEGLSGAFKTELAANVLMRFFGPDFHRENAPGSWFSTDNALEIQAHAAKDALFLIDDYRPPEGQDRVRFESKATRLLRNGVDRRGRDRARPDGSLQRSKYPRGTLMVTAEAGPPGGDQAAIGRTLVIKVTADRPQEGIVGTLDPDVLRLCAEDAGTGLYAEAMAGFVRWVAGRYTEISRERRPKINALTEQFKRLHGQARLHHRTPEIVADLIWGFDQFLSFARSVGVLDAQEAFNHREHVLQGLFKAAYDQREHHQDSDPVKQFLANLAAALNSGIAYLGERDGSPPAGIEAACGWRLDDPSDDLGCRARWRTTGRYKVGWVDGDQVLILQETAHVAADSIQKLSFDRSTVSRRLRDRGLLLETGKDGNITKQVTCEGTRHRVLVLPRRLIIPVEADTPDQEVGS